MSSRQQSDRYICLRTGDGWSVLDSATNQPVRIAEKLQVGINEPEALAIANSMNVLATEAVARRARRRLSMLAALRKEEAGEGRGL